MENNERSWLTKITCCLFHEWHYTEWIPLGFADWYRKGRCEVCNYEWEEER